MFWHEATCGAGKTDRLCLGSDVVDGMDQATHNKIVSFIWGTVGDGQENAVGHQAHSIAGRPVFAGFLVAFLVELANQFLEDRAHGVVVHAGMFHRAVGIEDGVGAEVDFGSRNLPMSGPRELEVLQDVLNNLREAVQVVFKIGEKLLLAASGFELATSSHTQATLPE